MTEISRLIHLLVYEDLPAAHDFLVEVFGFAPGGVESHDGVPVHAEVRAGDAVIWLHRVSPSHQLCSPKALAGASGGVYVQVDDAEAHCERSKAGGAQIDSAPRTMPYGMLEYAARDIEGHHWWFASPVKP